MTEKTQQPTIEVDETNEPDVLSNQTNFFNQELMQQTPPTLPVEVDPQQAEKELARKKKKRILILAGTGSVAIFLILIAVAVLLMPDAVPILTVTPSPIAFGKNQAEDQLSRRLDEVEADLHAADPVQVNTPYPPVNTTTLFLDDPGAR